MPFSEYCSPGFCVEEILCKVESLNVGIMLSLFNGMILQPSTMLSPSSHSLCNEGDMIIL